MVIFIFGLCHLLTIYKYLIFIYSGGYRQLKIILTKMTMTKMTAGWVLYTSPKQLLCKSLVSPIFRLFLGTDLKRTYNGGITDLERRQGCL